METVVLINNEYEYQEILQQAVALYCSAKKI